MLNIPSPLSGIRSPFGGRRWDPRTLFASADVGGIWDASVMTSLFQDSAGTTPVTAAGQPVGKMLDLSGKGNHYTQAVSASRPTYQVDGNGRKYLAFDGVDDGMLTGTITPAGGADKAQVFAGVRKLSDAVAGMVLELSANVNSNNGSFFIVAPHANGVNSFGMASKGTVTSNPTEAGYAAPYTSVLTMTADISAPSARLEVNNVSSFPSVASQGTGSYLAYPLYMGRRGGASVPFNGNMYAHIVRIASTNLTATQIAAAEAWINHRTGAY